ncbi:MAG TPA: hypothetical protein VE046_07325 [Steroidobacteraceae bacterium]|nr:hypothetical protein [Steroidobacteraceae bacterium]
MQAVLTPRDLPIAAPRSDVVARVLVATPVVAGTVFAKLAVPPLGVHGLGIVVPLTACAVFLGLASGRLHIVPRRLLLCLVMLSGLGLVQVLRADAFSPASLALMTALAVTYVFMVDSAEADQAWALRFFADLTAILAVLGIAQFVLQFVAERALVFPIETYVPEQFRTLGFHNIAPLYWGSPIFRSNGFVMLEPSEFSQVCAIGLVAELAGRARLLRLALYASALLVSYSGTGLIILAATLPLYVMIERRWGLLAPALVFVVAVALFSTPLHLDSLWRRIGEFASPGSSGFARFVGWRDLFEDKVWTSTGHALFGHGAGSFFEAASRYSASEMSYAKIIFEFGVLGALLYFAFIFYCLFTTRAPFIVRVAIGLCFFMNGAYAPSATSFALSLALWPNDGSARRRVRRLAGAPA